MIHPLIDIYHFPQTMYVYIDDVFLKQRPSLPLSLHPIPNCARVKTWYPLVMTQLPNLLGSKHGTLW